MKIYLSMMARDYSDQGLHTRHDSAKLLNETLSFHSAKVETGYEWHDKTSELGAARNRSVESDGQICVILIYSINVIDLVVY